MTLKKNAIRDGCESDKDDILKPEFIIVIFIHYKPRIAVAILDL